MLARSQTELNRALSRQASQEQSGAARESKEDGAATSWEGSEDLPPWVVDPDVMVPLLVAYDGRIGELEEANGAMGETLRAAQDKAVALTEENAALRSDLQRAIAEDLEAATRDPTGAAAAARTKLMADGSAGGAAHGASKGPSGVDSSGMGLGGGGSSFGGLATAAGRTTGGKSSG